MPKTKKTVADEVKRTEPVIKILLAAGVAIVMLLVLTVTFAGGYYTGSMGRKTARPTMRAADQSRGPMTGGRQLQGQNKSRDRQGSKRQQGKLGGEVVRGEVISSEGNVFVVKSKDSARQTKVTTGLGLKVLKNQQPSDIGELKVGDHVAAFGKMESGVLKADVVKIGIGAAPRNRGLGRRGGQGKPGPGGMMRF